MVKEETNGKGTCFSLMKDITRHIEKKHMRERVEHLKQMDKFFDRIIHYQNISKLYRFSIKTKNLRLNILLC